jgi:hypothetical protein
MLPSSSLYFFDSNPKVWILAEFDQESILLPLALANAVYHHKPGQIHIVAVIKQTHFRTTTFTLPASVAPASMQQPARQT